MPFPAATGAELGHQSGRKDKQTDKQPQAAGTGRIRANYSGGSGILCRDPEPGRQYSLNLLIIYAYKQQQRKNGRSIENKG